MNIQEEDMTYAKATLGNDNFPTDIEEQKVLGLSWNFHNDEFVIKLMTIQRGFWKMGRVEALIKGNDGQA